MVAFNEELMWIDMDARQANRRHLPYIKVGCARLKRSLSRLFSPRKLAKVALSSLVQHCHKKVYQADRCDIEEFFHSSAKFNWAHIPAKIRNRHSAFLVYRQQVESLQSSHRKH